MAESNFDRAYRYAMYGRSSGVDGLFDDYDNGVPIHNSYDRISLDGRSHLPGEAEDEFDAYNTGLSVTMSHQDHIFRGMSAAAEPVSKGVGEVVWETSVDSSSTTELASRVMADTVELTPVAVADETAQSEAA